jgi:hypothetical protein
MMFLRKFVHDFDDRYIQILDDVHVVLTRKGVLDFIQFFIAHRITSWPIC